MLGSLEEHHVLIRSGGWGGEAWSGEEEGKIVRMMSHFVSISDVDHSALNQLQLTRWQRLHETDKCILVIHQKGIII